MQRPFPATTFAGIGYLLMKTANFAIKNVPDVDTRTYEVAVKAGDSLDKIARTQGSTVEVMKKLNQTAHTLRPGRVLKYQKASLKKVIVGWKPITTSSIAVYYNGGGDSLYAKKLDYALSLVRKGKAAVCAQ
jgi:LysM domain